MRVAVDTILDVFNGLETTHLEGVATRKKYPVLTVHERVLGYRTNTVVDAEGFEHSGKTKKCTLHYIKMKDILERLFQYNSTAWQMVRESQQHWRDEVAKRGQPDFTISDACHGTVFAEHPELGEYFRTNPKFCEGCEKYRLACGVYSDGVATENPLGFARGNHSIECFYIVLFNLDPSVRMSVQYIMPFMLCLSSDLKQFGPCTVFSGASNDATVKLGTSRNAPVQIRPGGVIVPSVTLCPGAELRAFNEPDGILMEVPIKGENGITTYQQRPFGMWCISLHADFPAAGKLTPCAESTSARYPSRASNWDSRASNADAPSSFLRKFTNKPPDPARKSLWELRSLQQVEQQIGHATTLRGGPQKVFMQSKGLNSLACACAVTSHFIHIYCMWTALHQCTTKKQAL